MHWCRTVQDGARRPVRLRRTAQASGLNGTEPRGKRYRCRFSALPAARPNAVYADGLIRRSADVRICDPRRVRAGRGGSDRATPTRSLAFVASAFDFSDHKAAAYAPQMTLDMYLAFPEDASKLIEVVDGWIVRCESAEPSHQAIQLNLLIAIREAAGLRDRAKQSCHRVLGDMDVLIADSPKLHFRRPDVVVYRCIDDDRGRWGRKPIAADCLIALEIVSADSITTDIRDKRAEYAAAGIPHYWIVRMTDNDGPAISVERLLLTSDGEYTREGLAIRGRDFHAIDTISPFPLKLTWEALDEGL